jgi:hypothetical protein
MYRIKKKFAYLPTKVWWKSDIIPTVTGWRKIFLRSYYVIELRYGGMWDTYYWQYYTGDYLNKADAEYTLNKLIEKS